MDYKKIIAKQIKLDTVPYEDVYNNLTVPNDAAMGDYCLPCFKFSKVLKKSPQIIAQETAAAFTKSDAFSSAEAVAGYVNFKLNRKNFIKNTLAAAEKKGENFAPEKPNGKTVVIDYSSVNIAKPFHIGHLLTTAIGGSLYRIFTQLGYKAVGVNHLGDWGTQFGKLIAAFIRWGSKADVEKRGITALNELYVKFHAEAEKDTSLEDEARGHFKKIEEGDAQSLALFSFFKDVTMREVERVYKRLGVQFDSYAGESFYSDKLDGIVQTLTEKNLLTQSDGAQVVDLEGFGMPPCLIKKSDGASLYASRDLAAAVYRKKTYDFHKNLYVVAYQQNLHFQQVFKVLQLMGYGWAEDCVHVPFGMVSLEGGGALSTRKGNVVYLNDVLETAVEKTREIIRQKNPDLINKEQTAEAVGTGAVIFFALQSARIKDVVFSFDKALNFDGETAPYIQYTHARCCSVLEKSAAVKSATAQDDLTGEEGFELVKLIARYDEVVCAAAQKYEPSILARYVVDVAQSFNRFYIAHKIAGDANRLKLTRLVRNVLKNGLDLLLIKAPNKM
ncbi:MAG: arginine--tRNA ligase [Firmicutes bacterium]|nr:arginine--tRNA ligase [Bacillota bacterium]